MELVWIGVAFACGMLVKRIGLPPLLGFLAAGFALEAGGVAVDAQLQELADLGVTLMLFAVGLKLKPKSLLKPEIGGVAIVHMLLITGMCGALFYGLARAGLPLFAALGPKEALIVAFALSFSSTVFAIKVLEDREETAALYASIAIGILVMQDVVAVVFLAASTGKVPSPWALGLLLLWPARRLVHRVLDQTGHGELLVLAGLTAALGGYALFDVVKVKGDLGALVLGVVLSGHRKTDELAKSLLSLKDVFLVGFFLTVGLSGLPTFATATVGVALLLVVPLKAVLFFVLQTRFKVRARTSLLTTLLLSNVSEFGLIVAALAVQKGWLGSEWLVTMAMSMACSFIVASPANMASSRLYARLRDRLKRWESSARIAEEAPIDVGEANALVIGMGRVGVGAYDELAQHLGHVVGIDVDPDLVAARRASGRTVVRGSAADPDFWERFCVDPAKVRLVLLAAPSHEENMRTLTELRSSGYAGPVAAVARHTDEVEALKAAGVEASFHLFERAGLGLAEAAWERYGAELPSR